MRERKIPTLMNDQLMSFYAQCDENGISNRDKIRLHQKVIRRVASTDKSKSYESMLGESDGIVEADGKLIGFGIHILNEDIYPLQSFEIYLRNCDLTGELDLSDQPELLFVDIYHNRISEILVDGAVKLRILGVQDNWIDRLDVSGLTACQGIDAGMNRLTELDVSHNAELVELYINDNQISRINLRGCPKLKYFYCHNNPIQELDTRANPMLRHLNATGCPMKHILSLAPQREETLPLELTAGEGGSVGLKFNPVYNAQWKETGEWQQSYYAYPHEGFRFCGWYDTNGLLLSTEETWLDAYGSSRVLRAIFEAVYLWHCPRN